jgi:hypothetical protein
MLHAKQQPVIDQPWIVDPVLVDYEGVHKGAVFQQRMPVAAIAGQP